MGGLSDTDGPNPFRLGPQAGWHETLRAVADYRRCLAQGRPFEAHEALETAWRQSGGPLERDPVAQALIQLAAAYVHRGRDQPQGAQTLRARVDQRLEAAKHGSEWNSTLCRWERLGIDLRVVLEEMREWPEDPRAWPEARDLRGLGLQAGEDT